MWTKLAKMSVRDAMILIAGKPGYGEQPRWLQRVADAANISRRAARSLWRGEIDNKNHRASIAVQRAAEIAQARKEALALSDKYQSMIGGMRAQDEDFFSAEIDRLERLVRVIGALDRAGIKSEVK